jgi:hypothetical protein
MHGDIVVEKNVAQNCILRTRFTPSGAQQSRNTR